MRALDDALQVRAPGLERGDDLERLAHGQARQQAAVLEHRPDLAALDSLGRGASEHVHAARGGLGKAHDDVEGGGLASAVGAEEGQDFSGLDRQAQPVHGVHRSEGLVQVHDLDRGC